MADEYADLLGHYRDRPYFLTVAAEPHLDGPEEFAAVVHYRDAETESEVEVARIDTAHGYTHFDKLFGRGQPKESLDLGLWEAITRLRNNWRRYAESYERT